MGETVGRAVALGLGIVWYGWGCVGVGVLVGLWHGGAGGYGMVLLPRAAWRVVAG